MPEMISQEELRQVQAGQTLYEKFVKDTRHRIQAGARIEDGPLTVDLNALRNEGVPLCIIVPTSALPVESGRPASPTVPIVKRDIQSFISLLDWTAGPERRCAILAEYRVLLTEYRAGVACAIRRHRSALYNSRSLERANEFVSNAVALQWALVGFRVAGLLYQCKIPGFTEITRLATRA